MCGMVEEDFSGEGEWESGFPRSIGMTAALAQWLEHRSYTPGVPSSNLGCGRSSRSMWIWVWR